MDTPLKSSDFFGFNIAIASRISVSVTGLLEKFSSGISSIFGFSCTFSLTSQGGISAAVDHRQFIKQLHRVLQGHVEHRIYRPDSHKKKIL
jgi:hypothetical protein